VHEGRDKLSGPSNTALMHRTDMSAKYICGLSRALAASLCTCAQAPIHALGMLATATYL
jgi:hypothetical protein